jgi:hypothetical protein
MTMMFFTSKDVKADLRESEEGHWMAGVQLRYFTP